MDSHSDDPRDQDHKDKSVLYYAFGKVFFDEKFRVRIFSDPKRAANSTGLDKCVVDALAAFGRDGVEDFVKKFNSELGKAAYNATFC